MTKQEARKYFLQQRNSLSEEAIQKYSSKITDQIKQSQLHQFQTFHIFLSIKEKKEIDTSEIIQWLWENKKKIYVSKVDGEELIHYELTSGTELKKNKWGIWEPCNQKQADIQQLDCIFIPLLAYDILGNRVGYGKGYYDRFLKNYSQATKIGLSIFLPIPKIKDLSLTDIPIDSIITPDYSSGFPMKEK